MKKRIYVQKEDVPAAKMFAMQVSDSLSDYDFIAPNVFEINDDWHHRHFTGKLEEVFAMNEIGIIS